MWARSTDGGVTFQQGMSGTITTVPLEQSVSNNSISPGGFYWSDMPNIAADPVDGTLYAVWLQYRVPNDKTTAAVYLSRGTRDAACWTTPIVVSPNYPNKYQFMPWVQVSHDHTVHVTFGANAPTASSPLQVAAYYVQSTDRGLTFSSSPTQLSNSDFTAQGFMGDYQAASVGGYTGLSETIMTTWTETYSGGGKDRWGRFGTFSMPTPTPTPCGPNTDYTFTQSTGAALVDATTDTNNHCDNCVTTINLPFPYTIYGQTYNGVTVSANGTLQFGSGNATPATTCLPVPSFNYTIFAHWHDLATTALSINYPCPGCGIFTSTSGVTPNQIFNIKWVTCWVVDGECLSSASGYPTFEVRLYEGQNKFELIYGAMPSKDSIESLDAVVGVQKDDHSRYTPFICSSGLTQGLKLTFTQACPALTPTSCTIQFQDVPSSNTFYSYIRCLTCRGIINGYPCGGVGEPCTCSEYPYFRPYSDVTRSQVAKMVSSSAGFNETPTSQTFEDIPLGSTFYPFVERLAVRGYINGYPCGQFPQEPCVPPLNRPYFRPGNPVTRGQLAKIVANAAGYSETPTSQTFEDVPSSNTFYPFVERIALRGIIAGYPCGGPFEPCQPGNRPYFRPNNNSTRGQTAKIVSQAFFPNCQTLGDMTDTPNNSRPKVPVSPTASPGRTVTPAPTYTTPTPWLPSPVPTVLLPSPVPTVPAPTIPVPTAAVP